MTAVGNFFRISIKRMCLGTFSRLARSLATIYIFARVRIILKSVLLSGHLINRYPSGKRFSIIYALCRQ